MQPVDIHEIISVRTYSPYTELHWVAAADAKKLPRPTRESFAVVTPDLGRRPWTDINPQPVRVAKGGSGGGATPALYFWQKTNSHVWCESQTEKSEVMWLDYTGRVERLWSQPFAIVWSEDDTYAGFHVPDFLGLLPTGRLIVFDVRPLERVNERATVQFEATAQVCARLGWDYEVLTGHENLASDALSWLKASRHERCRPPDDVTERILLHARSGASRAKLCEVASPSCPPRACSWVDYLAWHRHLKVSLDDRFDNESIYTTRTAS